MVFLPHTKRGSTKRANDRAAGGLRVSHDRGGCQCILQTNRVAAADLLQFQDRISEGKPVNPNAGVLAGWDVEIALDVQWAHAIAPGAKIVVVAAAGQDNEDLQDAMSYITKIISATR